MSRKKARTGRQRPHRAPQGHRGGEVIPPRGATLARTYVSCDTCALDMVTGTCLYHVGCELDKALAQHPGWWYNARDDTNTQ